MRDAIVVSGWTWMASNVPERIASTLARAGSRVLYCENPKSVVRADTSFSEVEKGIFRIGLRHFSHRLNSVPALRALQTKSLAKQILKKAALLKLNDPVFIYPHGEYCLHLCREFKRRGYQLIHICMDYELELVKEHVRASDLSLVIPRRAFEQLRLEFGGKVLKIPQVSYFDDNNRESPNRDVESSELSKIMRPRLGYLGGSEGRLSLPLLKEVLLRRPEWQFLYFDSRQRLDLPNEHTLPWRSQGDLRGILKALDVGFMPYDCGIPKNLHCVPLKLFDYFTFGLPVVSTPIEFLKEFEELVYLGSTPEELIKAISDALCEPADSPKRARRVALAQQHSIGSMAQVLAPIFDKLNSLRR